MKKAVLTVGTVTAILAASTCFAQTKITSLPYNITKGGQYYIDGNLTSTGDGITVGANDVTIDLNGSTIAGKGIGFGIQVGGSKNVEIRNGSVSNFQHGVFSAGAQTTRVIDIRAVNNTGMGIYVDDATGCVIRNSSATNNAGGINGWYCLIEGNTANFNTEYGITAGQSKIINNIAVGNTGNGIQVEASGGMVKNNSSYNNSQFGIYFEGDSHFVDGNTVYNNATNMNVCISCTVGLNLAP